jgi:hypothetical protein
VPDTFVSKCLVEGTFEDVYLVVTERGGGGGGVEPEPINKGGNYLAEIVNKCWSSWIFWSD